MPRPFSSLGTQLSPLLGFVAFGAVAAVLAGERVRGLLLSSASVAAPAALLAMGLALPMALVIARGSGRLRWPLLVVTAGMLLLPPHVVAAGWNALATRCDWFFTPATVDQPSWFLFSGWRGAVLLHALAATPCAALLSSVALAGVDARREELALTEGPPLRVLRCVTLPLAGAGLAAAAAFVAVFISAEIAITDLMRVRTFAEEIYIQASLGAFEGVGAWGAAGGWRLVAGALVLASVVGWALWVIVSAADRAWSDASDGIRAQRFLAGKWGVALPAVAVTAALFLAPAIALIAQVGQSTVRIDGGFERVWSASAALSEFAGAPWRHRRELAASGALALVTATTVVVVSGVAAWLVRKRRGAAVVVGGLAAAVLATPGPLLGILAINLFNQPDGSWLAPISWVYNSWALPWLVQAIRFLPIGGLLLAPLVRATPVDMVSAARLDGAGVVSLLVRVVGPLNATGLAACWLVVFALSFGELSATALVVPPGDPPIAVRLLSLLHYGVEERVAALSLWFFGAGVLLAACVVTLLGLRRAATQS